MKRKLIIGIFLLLSILTFSKETTNVASFNVLHLGWKGKNYKELAEVVSLFELVGLLEVMKEEGLQKLEKELEKQTKQEWTYHISKEKIGRKTYKEYYAYIWQDKKVKLKKVRGFYKETKSDDFIRQPYGVDFKIGKFDFTFVILHSIFGDKKAHRAGEAMLFDEVYDYFQKLNGKEQDVIIAGDFNLPAYDKAFKGILSHKDQIVYAIDPKNNKTTIGKSALSSSYDNMFFSYKYTKEFTGNYGVFDFTNNNHKTIRRTLSDHLPVFMEFDISKDDDEVKRSKKSKKSRNKRNNLR